MNVVEILHICCFIMIFL